MPLVARQIWQGYKIQLDEGKQIPTKILSIGDFEGLGIRPPPRYVGVLPAADLVHSSGFLGLPL